MMRWFATHRPQWSPASIGGRLLVAVSARRRVAVKPLLSLVLAGVWLAGCGPRAEPQIAAPPAVEVAPVSAGHLQREFRVSGVVRPVARAQLAFQTDGVILERLVDLGDRVEPGQLLAVIRNPRLHPEEAAALATVSEIRARRDQAQRDLERLRQLRVERAVGEEQVEQKAADLAALNASLQRAQAQLQALSGLAEEASLRAPFAGEITQVLAEPGEYVRPGQAVLALGAPETLEVAVQLPAQYAGLQAGEALPVQIPMLDLRTTGHIDQISSQAAPGTGLFPMVVRLEGVDNLRAGLRAEVLIPWQSPGHSLLVPLASVVDPIGGHPRVYRVIDGKVQQVDVELGLHQGRLIAVNAQPAILDVGDQVVVSGHQSLTDGQLVQVRQ